MVPKTPVSDREAAGSRQALRRGEHASAILAAANRLVEGRRDFTTQELIKESGVALKTFYRHYTSKDHLLIALIADRVQTNATWLEAEADTKGLLEPPARLEFFVKSPLLAMNSTTDDVNPSFITAEHWRLHQLYPAEVVEATRPYSDLIRRTLEAGRADGTLSVRDPERDAWLMATMVMAVFHHYAFHPDDPGRATVADGVWAFCEAAVKAKAGGRKGGSAARSHVKRS